MDLKDAVRKGDSEIYYEKRRPLLDFKYDQCGRKTFQQNFDKCNITFSDSQDG